VLNQKLHQPVLLSEAIEALNVQPEGWYVDGTFGRGGHTAAILKKQGRVLAFDIDQEAISYGQTAFAQEIKEGNLVIVRENFDHLRQVITAHPKISLDSLKGFLFDFGTSSDQLLSAERGFSFDSDQVLDMRMDQRLGVTANDLLNVLPENQLRELFQEYGGEHEARNVARAIKKWQAQQSAPATFTGRELAGLISNVKRERGSKLHPATKIFQALRIAVNQELDSIQSLLAQVKVVAVPGNRLVSIAFHEGEDRIVKHQLIEWEKQGRGHRVNKSVIVPSLTEIETNPRSRSAKMRIFEYASK